MSSLKEIEKKISGFVKIDKKNWVRIFFLMEEVESRNLYLERPDTPSFTTWVNALADELGVHASLLWKRQKAGKVYEEYRQRAESCSRSVPELEDVSVSPESLNLCEKVARKNVAEKDRLIDRVLSGELNREDLRAAARAKRDASIESGVTNSKATSRCDCIEIADRIETETQITAADIILALRRSDWLPERRTDPHFAHVYHCFSEFRVDTGSSRYSRRMDALIAETLTEVEKDRVVLRGVEIKVSLHDLASDHKMAEYTDFVDFFYIAIPDDNSKMLEVAKSLILPSWGIITVNKDGKIHVLKEPERLKSIFREKTLSTALIKMVSRRG